jgi:kynurenine formamidase
MTRGETPAGQQPRAPEVPVSVASRRRFLKTAALGSLAFGATIIPRASVLDGSLVEPASAAPLPGWPMTETWFPSRWGSGDQAGASNYMTPAKALEAASLIKTGKVYSLGRVYEAGMPFFGTRSWNLKIPGPPFYGPAGRNKLIANEEYLCAEIGQVGSQFDGLAHIGVETKGAHDTSGKLYYNGFNATEVHGPFGMKKLGVEHVRPFVTRGVLFDVKGLKGRNLNRGEEITAQDLKDAIARQGMTEADFREGDVALVRTGWGDQWMVVDNKKYYDGEPGVGIEACQWLIDKGACLIAADNWGVEVQPSTDPELSFPAHHLCLTMNGVYMFENLTFEAAVTDGVYRAAFFFSPVPVKGATGSPGNPILIA